jgi:uncharacterized repeat protein (TIGR01451 family)
MTALLLPGTVSAAGLSISIHHNRVFPTTIESYFMGGTNGTYTINVVNSGPATTGLITVTDILPNALTFVSAAGNNWNCSAVSGTVTCTTTQSIPNMGTSSSILLTVMVTPLFGSGAGNRINLFNDAQPATAVINNAATVTAANANIDNGTQVDVVEDAFPIGSGLVVQIASNGGPAGNPAGGLTSFIGSTGSYSIVLLNLSTTATVNPVSISVSLPAGMTVSAGTGANWACTGASCTYSAPIASLASSSVLNVVVGIGAAVSGFVQATASITNAGGAPVAQGTGMDILGVNVIQMNHADGTLTTIQATPNPTFPGVPVTITTTTKFVSGGVPSGNVSFSVTGNNPPTLPAVPVNVDSNGQVSFVTVFPAAGEYTITASFNGGTNPSQVYYVQRIDVPTTGPTINGNVYTFCNTNPVFLHKVGGSPLTSINSPDPLNIFVNGVPGTVQTVQVDLLAPSLEGSEAVLIGPDRRLQNFAF